jgi:proton-translocating NADH-quinone oxidoreductase chain N
MLTNPLFWMVTIPLAASPVNYLVGRLAALNRSTHTTTPSPARWLALLALLAAWVPYASSVQAVLAAGPQDISWGMVHFRIDGLGLVIAGISLALGALVVVFSGPYLAGEEGEEKYYSLLTAMIGAILGLGFSADLFNLWIWFEVMAISSFFLVAFYRHLPAVLEAGVKYLVQSAVGSALVLMGIALVFLETGVLNLEQIRATAQPSGLLTAAGALFLIGFGVKAALVPMHTWLPDAHSQAPSGISALLSGVVIEAGLVALLRALGPLSGVTHLWPALLIGFAAVNMVVGNLMALRQTQVKRLLAFSSLSHIGYMLLGFGVAAGFQNPQAAGGALFHLINHALMKGLAFLAAGTLLYALRSGHGDHHPLMAEDLSGAANRYPWAALGLSLALFGLAGLPPLAGFMSKWQIFTAGFQTQVGWVQALVIFGALNSVLSLGYYAPLVNTLYRRKPGRLVTRGLKVPIAMQLPVFLLAASVIILGIWPGLISNLIETGGRAVLALFGS